MAYENPDLQVYHWNAQTLTANITLRVPRPKNKGGRVMDYGVTNVTAAVNGATTQGTLQIGKTGELDRFGKAITLANVPVGPGYTLKSEFQDDEIFDKTKQAIKNGDDIIITWTAPTGTPTGAGDIFVVIGADL